MNTLTINLPEGFKAENKWQDGQSIKDKFAVLLVPLKAETVKGEFGGKAYEYIRVANIADGKGKFAGGRVYGTTPDKKRVSFKVIGKLLEPEGSKATGNTTDGFLA